MSKRLLWFVPLVAAVIAAVLWSPGWRSRDAMPSRDGRTVDRGTTTDGVLADTAVPSPSSDAVSLPSWFEAVDAGIGFRYVNGGDPSTPGARMFEFAGGGVGVFDFDRDGRPDLHFTQGSHWPPDTSQREHLDCLYRNLGDRFVDATDAAGIVEPGFSQGVACGDFDGDGFADLYVANIGENRLFRNNGDGTFSDVTKQAGIAGTAWTTSVAIADLNGDKLPELFDVNYVQGSDVFERLCDHDGVTRICSPTVFDAQDDRLLLNRGDGAFTEVTAIAGVDAANGTGLGVAVADFDGTGRLDLFVANDARNNHFYKNQTTERGSLPRFDEQAEANGTAFDFEGRAQACMGIAVGDVDGDTRLDLFVTNYVEESNTLYLQTNPGLFVDASREAGLRSPSIPMLGFGTQFLDADLDGWEDLVVVNGHVDDFTHQGYEHAMRPQFFRNLGGRFVELPAATAGPFFDTKRLGRGLARLDWNGDGREEFVVSELDDRAQLLTNTVPAAGRSIALRMVATRSARDALGTTVVVEAGGSRFVRQLTAGDGYQASNERVLVFGLGSEPVADSVTVRWLSGETSRFTQVRTGTSWLIIEGRSRLLQLEGFSTEEDVANDALDQSESPSN